MKAALAEAARSQEAQFSRDWQERLKQLKAEEVRPLAPALGPTPAPALACALACALAPAPALAFALAPARALA